MSIRTIIADDESLMRSGLRLLLGAADDIEIIAEAAHGAEAIDLARKLSPDLILMDIRMPVMDGLEATRALMAQASHPEVLILTAFGTDEFVLQALRAGAAGYILKDTPPDELIHAVRAAANGDALISPSLTLDLLSRRAQDTRTGEDRLAGLSERENDVARLVARGRTNQEICAELYISLGTVKSHLGSIQTRLGARNRVEIAARMWESGAMNSGR